MMNGSNVITLSAVTTESNHVFESIHDGSGGEHMTDIAYLLTATTLFSIGFFGFFLNLFVIILMCKDMQIWTPMNIILLNLVCSDFSVSIIGNPFALLSAWHHKWIFGDSLCVAYGFFMSLLGITSITTLTVLAYERYCMITHPFSSSHLSYKGAKYSVLFIWVYSFIVTSPPLFGWGAYVSEAANISCSVNWESQTFNATTYIVFLFIFGLFVPLCVISYSYIMIIKTMKQNSIRAGKVNKIENKVTRMIAIMIIAFLVAWTPYSVFALSEQFGDPELITPALAVLPALIAKSSICYNPCIYVISNSQFRASWRRVFGKDVPGTTTLNETVVHQISEMSSRVVLECTFSNDKKKRDKKPKESRKIPQNFMMKPIGNKELAKLIEEKIPRSTETITNGTKLNDTSDSCEYEMKMIFIASNECKDEKINETQDLE